VVHRRVIQHGRRFIGAIFAAVPGFIDLLSNKGGAPITRCSLTPAAWVGGRAMSLSSRASRRRLPPVPIDCHEPHLFADEPP